MIFSFLIITLVNFKKTKGIIKKNRLNNNSNKERFKLNNLKFFSIKKVSIEKRKSDKNNAEFVLRFENNRLQGISLLILKDIDENEEVCVTYGYEFWIHPDSLQ